MMRGFSPGLFQLLMKTTDQSLGTGPVVLDSPHSGTDYPQDFAHACDRRSLRRAEDTHVERIFEFARELDTTLIAARFPRSYIDANRARDDIDKALLCEPWPTPLRPSAKVRLGKGLVWRTLDDGTPIYDSALSVRELQHRINNCWEPYHRALDTAVAAALQRHGHVIHINCHSMPSVAQAYSTEFPGVTHPDFVLGDRDHTSAAPALTEWIAHYLRDLGYSVGVNHPYKGVELVRRHGRPAEGRHSIQFEINKRLYMDEDTLALHDGFGRLQRVLREMLVELSAMRPPFTQDHRS